MRGDEYLEKTHSCMINAKQKVDLAWCYTILTPYSSLLFRGNMLLYQLCHCGAEFYIYHVIVQIIFKKFYCKMPVLSIIHLSAFHLNPVGRRCCGIPLAATNQSASTLVLIPEVNSGVKALHLTHDTNQRKINMSITVLASASRYVYVRSEDGRRRDARGQTG